MTKRGNKGRGTSLSLMTSTLFQTLNRQKLSQASILKSSKGKGRDLLLNSLTEALVKPLIPALGRTKQEDYQFKASQSYRSRFNTTTTQEKKPLLVSLMSLKRWTPGKRSRKPS